MVYRTMFRPNIDEDFQADMNLSPLVKFQADAGSQFDSADFRKTCIEKLGIDVSLAAPKHQEMNGICERTWQSLRNLAFSFLNHARVGNEFGDMAFEYAWRILSVLPIKKNDGSTTTAFYEYYGRKPTIRRLRVLFCPCFYKVYEREKKDPKTNVIARYNSSTHPQRGVPGVFCGLPRGQAGWLVYDPRSKILRVSADVVFDETFGSLGPAQHFAFRDAVPVYTADTWQSDPTKFVSSVPADDHYGPPQTTYLEDYPSDGFLISSRYHLLLLNLLLQKQMTR